MAITGVNLVAVVLHAVIEGMRWQMGFSYLFVAVLAGITIVHTNDAVRNTKAYTIFKAIGSAIALVGLGVTAVVALAFPVFTLPTPTGDYPVGITYLHLVDNSRMDPFLDAAPRPRELMVKVYYPAAPDTSLPVAPYFNGSSALIRLLTAHYNMPDFILDHLALVKTHSREGAPFSDAQPTYPLILFSHGAGTSMEDHTTTSEDLASHGYIVAAIDHTYVSMGTVFPDRVVSEREATTMFDVSEPAAPITQIMADDTRFVLDELTAMNDVRPTSIFAGRLDLDHVGAMGHSVGGAVAYNLAINDSRVKAAVNLDGAVYVMPNGGADTVAPLLMLANDQYHVQALQAHRPLLQPFDEMEEVDRAITIDIYGSEEAYTAAYEQARQNVEGLLSVLAADEGLYAVRGCDHMKFTDIGMFIGLQPVREAFNIRGATEPARCLEVANAASVAFFDGYLKGDDGERLETLNKTYTELEKVAME